MIVRCVLLNWRLNAKRVFDVPCKLVWLKEVFVFSVTGRISYLRLRETVLIAFEAISSSCGLAFSTIGASF